MSTTNKILVIGAGIAEPAVCYWLRRFGFSPVLIEKFANVRKGGHGLDVRGVAIDLVKKMGIYEKICNKRTTVKLGQYVDTGGNILHEERGESFSFRQGEEVEIYRGDLVEILMATIEDVPLYFNIQVDSIRQNANHVEVHFKNGKSEQYDLVIGADGMHSTTRHMVFNGYEYQLINLGAYFSTFSIPNYLNLSHAEVQCEANQKLISITSDKNPKMAEAAFMFRSQTTLNNIRDVKEQREFLRNTFKDFGWEAAKLLELMAESSDFYFDSVTQVKMKSWTK